MEFEAGAGWPDWQADVGYGGLVIEPPPEIARVLDPIRQRLDPVAAAVLGPHITLTPGFIGAPSESDEKKLAAILGSIEPMTLKLGLPTQFSGSAVVYLTVEPRAEIDRLRMALMATGLFRLDEPYTDDFVPHLTLSVAADAVDAALLAPVPQPAAMIFCCESVAWFVADRANHFTIRRTFALGGAGTGAST
jgi:2'-5' RNA ligase